MEAENIATRYSKNRECRQCVNSHVGPTKWSGHRSEWRDEKRVVLHNYWKKVYRKWIKIQEVGRPWWKLSDKTEISQMWLENPPLMGEKFLKIVHKYQQWGSTKMEVILRGVDDDLKWATSWSGMICDDQKWSGWREWSQMIIYWLSMFWKMI